MKTPLNLEEFIHHTEHSNLLCSAIQGDHSVWCDGNIVSSHSPIDLKLSASFRETDNQTASRLVKNATYSAHNWAQVPAPIRGQLIKQIGQLASYYKEELAHYIILEVGKTKQEALGEVQEWIDMCDFAVGLSRQLHGLTIASERAEHQLQERWHPLGTVLVITAFNFPMAVWAWNTMLAIICGNSVIWKPSEQTPLCSVACAKIFNLACETLEHKPPASLHTLVMGGKDIASHLAKEKQISLVSATGSVAMGKSINQIVASRLARTLLELSGNNAMIISNQSDQKLALRAVLFSAIGTSGQRCTSLRRLIVQQSIANTFIAQLKTAYESIRIGDPRIQDIHMGPVINDQSYQNMQQAIELAQHQGGHIIFGGERLTIGVPDGGYYVRPALIEIDKDADILQQEIFAPVLFIIRYQHFSEALAINNHSTLGLSSAIFSTDIRECEQFLSSSDCGIANVNVGTSGAEIGGAFGGEKDTGGGRESGSDAWKNYMRRSTNTINYGHELPLAQGIKF